MSRRLSSLKYSKLGASTGSRCVGPLPAEVFTCVIQPLQPQLTFKRHVVELVTVNGIERYVIVSNHAALVVAENEALSPLCSCSDRRLERFLPNLFSIAFVVLFY